MVVGWWFGRQFLDGVEGGGAIFRCLGARPCQFQVEFSIGVGIGSGLVGQFQYRVAGPGPLARPGSGWVDQL